jgi:uncharacterized SAM-binding protein YcdF (DUF218 family)
MLSRQRIDPEGAASSSADAIVVLGCPPGTEGAPSAALRRRLECGLALYRAGAAPLLLLSGGGAGAVAEAEIMRRLAREAGVPEGALLLEPRSRDTLGNARESARLLGRHGLSRVLLVSDRPHLLRARILFALAGLEVVGEEGPSSSSRRAAARYRLRELASIPLSLLRALLLRP